MSLGYLDPDHFNQIFSAHGSIMIIFMAMPFLVGLMNIVVPQQIGSRDVAFPFYELAQPLANCSRGVADHDIFGFGGVFSKPGGRGMPPLTETEYSPGVGVDYWIWSFPNRGYRLDFDRHQFSRHHHKNACSWYEAHAVAAVFVWTTFFHQWCS